MFSERWGNAIRRQHHVTKDNTFGNWPLEAILPLDRGIPPRHETPYGGHEQFWGRAVRASRDSYESGALLI